MKLSKAIEIMELNIKEAGTKMPPDCKQALLLHIQAAKRLQIQRQNIVSAEILLLLGETPEGDPD